MSVCLLSDNSHKSALPKDHTQTSPKRNINAFIGYQNKQKPPCAHSEDSYLEIFSSPIISRLLLQSTTSNGPPVHVRPYRNGKLLHAAQTQSTLISRRRTDSFLETECSNS